MSELTQKAIMQEFQQLLDTTPFDKITVSAITKRCGIHHNTFYYHYKDVYELLETWLRHELGHFMDEQIDGEWKNNVKALLYACKQNSSIVYHIFNSISRDQLERYVFTLTDDAFTRYVRERSEGNIISEDRIQEIASFCRYALLGYFLKFLWNNMTDNVDESVDRLNELVSDFVSAALSSPQNP